MKKRIFCIIGKSAAGKSFTMDTMSTHQYYLGRIKVLPEYTTRPLDTLRTDDKAHIGVTDKVFERDAHNDDVVALNPVPVKYPGMPPTVWRYYYRISDIKNATTDLVCQSDPIMVKGLLDHYESATYVEIIPVYVEADENERQRKILVAESKKPVIHIKELTRRIDVDNDMYGTIGTVEQPNGATKFIYYGNPKWDINESFIGYKLSNTYNKDELAQSIVKMLNAVYGKI